MKVVLIVEDNALVVELLRQLLEERYVLLTAANGKLGVEAVRKHKPDIVLMDLMMPVMDGWAAIRALRADAATASIPIIALSARVDSGDVERSLGAGADAHLGKPIEDGFLLSEIERLLRGRRVRSGAQLTRTEVADLVASAKKDGQKS